MISPEKIIEKRLKGKAAPPENPQEYEATKSEFLAKLEEVLGIYGVKKEVEILFQRYRGEGTTHVPSIIRTTPLVSFDNKIPVKITEDIIANGPDSFTTDRYYITVYPENKKRFPVEGSIYTAGSIQPGIRKESFVAVENGRKATIDEVREGIDLVENIEHLLTIYSGFETASERPSSSSKLLNPTP